LVKKPGKRVELILLDERFICFTALSVLGEQYLLIIELCMQLDPDEESTYE
jgi:hypothetical protein